MEDAWQLMLIGALVVNAVLGFGYRVFRLAKGGPIGDVVGQAILGVVLLGLAAAVGAEAAWARPLALIYGLLFGLAVMPIWTLAVLIPLEPRAIDYAFTSIYWLSLVAVVVAAVLA